MYVDDLTLEQAEAQADLLEYSIHWTVPGTRAREQAEWDHEDCCRRIMELGGVPE